MLSSADGAEEYVRDLAGRSIEVQYNPGTPSRSALTNVAIDAVQASRPPAVALRKRRIPSWLNPLLWPLVIASLTGLTLSLWVHIAAVAGRRMGGDSLFIGLHMGIFVVFAPAVVVAQGVTRASGEKDFWKDMLRGTPAWVRYALYAFSIYAAVNFMYFYFKVQRTTELAGSAMEWRMFSGHWMAFYSAAAAILYSAAGRQEPEENLCLNGHRVDSTARFCPVCGQPVSHAPSLDRQ